MTKILVLIGLLCVASTAFAQRQEGSVAIAKAIVPAPETLLSGFNECVRVQESIGVDKKQSNKVCLKAMEQAGKTSRRIANEAADATKASRLPRVVGGYGYGYASYGGFRYRSVPQRPLPPPRRW